MTFVKTNHREYHYQVFINLNLKHNQMRNAGMLQMYK